MNKTITSKEKIISISKQIAQQKALNCLNMREIASLSEIAVGSIYNYFPSKNDLIMETIKSIWNEISEDSIKKMENRSFIESVEILFQSIRNSEIKYPHFLNNHGTIISNKNKGMKMMSDFFDLIKKQLLKVLNQDKNLKESFFTKECSKEEFIDFIFANLVNLSSQKGADCRVLKQIIRASIYQGKQ